MKHVRKMTKNVPAKAFFSEDHPDIGASVKGFIQDPMEVVSLHLQKEEPTAE